MANDPVTAWIRALDDLTPRMPRNPIELIIDAFSKPKPVVAPPVVTPPVFTNPAPPDPPRVQSRMPVPVAGGKDFAVGVPTAADIATATPNLLPPAPMLPPPPQIGVPPALDIEGIKRLLQTGADTSGATRLLNQPGPSYSRAEELLAQRTDPSNLRAILDQMKPDANSNLANVLSGLAGGAGSIDATSAGSFARALAGAGAGGTEGLAKTGRETRDYAGKRAGVELDIEKLLSGQREKEAGGLIDINKAKTGETLHRAGGLLDVARLQSGERGQNITGGLSLTQMQSADANARNELAFKNASSVYETGVKNEMTKFAQQQQTQGLLMPKIQHDANGITVQRIDPATGKLDVQFHPTKTILDNAEKMKPMLEALNLPGPAAEAEEAKFVMNSFPDPMLKQEALKNLAVRRTILAGAGGTVFGPLYDTAVKTATKQLQTENPTLVAKPDEYQKEMNSRVASIIMADARIHDLAWTKYAAPHSIAARLIADAMSKKAP
jgi:hypothetical protein